MRRGFACLGPKGDSVDNSGGKKWDQTEIKIRARRIGKTLDAKKLVSNIRWLTKLCVLCCYTCSMFVCVNKVVDSLLI